MKRALPDLAAPPRPLAGIAEKLRVRKLLPYLTVFVCCFIAGGAAELAFHPPSLAWSIAGLIWSALAVIHGVLVRRWCQFAGDELVKIIDTAKTVSARATEIGCPMYGRSLASANLGLVPRGAGDLFLIATGGNQCAMVTTSHSPCMMETTGFVPDWKTCPLLWTEKQAN